MKILRYWFFVVLIFIISCPMFAAPATMDTYDMTYLSKRLNGTREDIIKSWDEMHFITAIQGLANRKNPNLYVFFNESTDKFWLDKMTAPNSWMAKTKITKIDNLDGLIFKYRSYFKGAVVYDGNVAATSNVASTIAGCDNLVPVRYDESKDSLYYYLIVSPNGPRLHVKKWLVNRDGSALFTGSGKIPGTDRDSTGSAKNDAYIWAKINYLDKGKCSKQFMGYYIDFYWTKVSSLNDLGLATLVNQDFQIANKGFVFDLGVWEDEGVIDDPNQKPGLDLETFKEILHSAYKQANGGMVQISGFTPWNYKYTRFKGAGGKHGEVDTEWRHAELLSNFNAYMDADAVGYSDMANASVFSKFPLKKEYKQFKPTIDDLKGQGLIDSDGKVKEKSYVCFYVGDYDSAAWLNRAMPEIWEDPARGLVPLGWAINPQLAQRFAFGMDYFRNTATQFDSFVAGDNGAGYLNPGSLIEPRQFSGLPDGVDAWKLHCQKWFKQFDISSVGFVIDGFAPKMNERLLDAYAEIAPDGIGGQKLPSNQGVYKNIMPYIAMGGVDRPSDAVRISGYLGKNVPEFMLIRNILWTPTMQKEFMDTMREKKGSDVVFLDPYSFFLLMKHFYETGQTAGPKKYDNLFHHAGGMEIIEHTPVLDGIDARDMFMGELGTSPERTSVIFKDGMPDDYINSVVYKTKAPVSISRLILRLRGDQINKGRQIKAFRLFAKENQSDNWKEIWKIDFNSDQYTILNQLKLDQPITAQYFRAEFDQYNAEDGQNTGARIVELEAYSK